MNLFDLRKWAKKGYTIWPNLFPLFSTFANLPTLLSMTSLQVLKIARKSFAHIVHRFFAHSLSIGARGSPLSRAQVEEVARELASHHAGYRFVPHWIVTHGDYDQKTSLRMLEKTDFFTKEVDEQQLNGAFRISIHSAKDLPEPLKTGLTVVAITKGVDPSDVLVIRDDVLPNNPVIGTSSIRREKEILKAYPGAKIVDIRGAIHERLAQLDSGKFDGVVIAKAALIRLGIENRKEIPLACPVAPLQGQLAVVARSDDTEMAALFSCIDCRPRLLYTGLEPPEMRTKRLIHHPLIKTVPLNPSFEGLKEATHVILTSKMAVTYFMERVSLKEVQSKQFISVGKMTTEKLSSYGISAITTAHTESQEGIIELLKESKACIFWPHSTRSRPILLQFLEENGFSYTSCELYDTQFQCPAEPIDFDQIDEIFFSSSSTVDAFFSLFGPPPKNKKLLTQGSITENHLTQRLSQEMKHLHTN
jgi:hydroxymethylbilane synthase